MRSEKASLRRLKDGREAGTFYRCLLLVPLLLLLQSGKTTVERRGVRRCLIGEDGERYAAAAAAAANFDFGKPMAAHSGQKTGTLAGAVAALVSSLLLSLQCELFPVIPPLLLLLLLLLHLHLVLYTKETCPEARTAVVAWEGRRKKEGWTAASGGGDGSVAAAVGQHRPPCTASHGCTRAADNGAAGGTRAWQLEDVVCALRRLPRHRR